MAQHAILRFEKHKGNPARPLEAHHERQKEQYASNPNIDTSRSKYNFHIVKPEGRYYHFIQNRIEQAGCRTRRDSTRFVDTLITASPEFFKKKSPKEIQEFFQRAADFLIGRVGKENIVSAVVHMDEKTPHLHLVFVPLTEDNRLCAKEIIGNRANLTKWQDDFHAYMVEKYPDLERGESASKTGRKHPPEVREQVREELGLNRPILEQYVSFVTNAVKGDFGKSYIYKVDVLSLIAQRVPATLELVFVSVVLALVISIPLGVYAGAFPKRKSSTLVMGGSILGISLPSFFIGIMLIYIFSLKLHWFPSSGRGATAPFLGMNFSLFAPGGLKYIILPAFTLSVTNIASLVRLTRAGVMENMRQDYIKFARAKGVSTRKVLFGHALKNALIPVITVFGMEIGSLIAFTTVTETIFSWPGLGKLLIDSINSVDRPVIVAYLILTTVLFVFINFVVDLLYTVIDPRIQFR